MLRVERLMINSILVILCLFPLLAFAHEVLPADLLNDFGRFTETDPPQGPVRPIAEFEPASHVLIRYPLGIPVSLVVQLANTAEVVCIVSSSSTQSQAASSFNSAGVDMDNVSFLIAPTDSYWTRDFGPWFIFDGNDNYGVVDFRYNRPRPNDNLIPQVFADQNDLDYYGMNLYQTGGNYMTDGINTAAQTTIAYSENPSLTPAQVDLKMQDYLGITSYHVLQDPNNTYIDHIDCWGKFLAPDKVLIRSVPDWHPQYDELEQTAGYFANLDCAWGYPYKVYRVNTPQNQPYTNSMILNDRVFVPIMNSTHDSDALQVYADAMPGYEVTGVSSSGYISWESTDALHCRTHEIPDKNMLYISHLPYWGEQPYGADLDINATIKAHSGQPVYPDSVFVCYKINEETWQTMLLTNIGNSNYTTSLGGFVPGDTIRYYIHAADQSGRAANHPRFADLEPHVFTVVGDIQAPVISHEPISEIQNGPTVFMVTVTDNEGVGQVSMRYKIDDGAILDVEMESLAQGSDIWYCTVDSDFDSGDTIFHYQFEASDTATPANVSYYPSESTWITVPIVIVSNDDNVLPNIDMEILGVYPNPFCESASAYMTIEYKTVANIPHLLKIFNSRGQAVAVKKTINSPSNLIRYLWNGMDMNGNKVSAGVYFVRLQSGSNSLTRKLLILE